MARHCGMVILLMLLIPVLAPVHAASSTQTSADAIDSLVAKLASASATERQGAEVRLYLLPPADFPLLQAAALKPDLKPDVAAKMREIVERQRAWYPARMRQVRRREAAQNWAIKYELAAYEKYAKHSPDWDTDVRAGIRLAASGLTKGDARTALDRAIHAGCDDPFVIYLDANQSTDIISPDESAAAFRRAANMIEQINYAPACKLMVFVRATAVIRGLAARHPMPAGNGVGGGVDSWFAPAMGEWPNLLKETGVPPHLIIPLWDELLAMTRGLPNESLLDTISPELEKAMPDSDLPHLLKGKFYIEYAWYARGSDVAANVTPEGWKLMAERLNLAEQELTRAWEINPAEPDAAVAMIGVVLGKPGGTRAEMEQWFDRAIRADPDSQAACNAKLYYLEPKWHGSDGEMVSFAWQCRNSQNWFGGMPEMLIRVHDTLSGYFPNRALYFRRPGVWRDLQAVYEPLLAAYPENHLNRSAYAFYACACAQWAEARRQFDLLGNNAVAARFGGPGELKKFQALARNNGSLDAP